MEVIGAMTIFPCAYLPNIWIKVTLTSIGECLIGCAHLLNSHDPLIEGNTGSSEVHIGGAVSKGGVITKVCNLRCESEMTVRVLKWVEETDI